MKTNLLLLCLMSLSIQGIAQYKNMIREDKKIALIFGNADYSGSSNLCVAADNCPPVNDANDLSDALQSLGFETMVHTDIKEREMKKVLNDFGETLKSGKYQVALVHFSGHGSEVDGKNYLYPIDVSPQDVKERGVSAERIITRMNIPQVKVRILLLDACRTDPSKGRGQWGGRDQIIGFAKMDAPKNTFIGFATSRNRLALNTSLNRRNGLYTEAILKHIKTSNMTIRDVFDNLIGTTVEEYSLKLDGVPQTSWSLSSMRFSFYFNREGNFATSPNLSGVSDNMVFVKGGMLEKKSKGREYVTLKEYEKISKEKYLDEFYIAKYETTNQQFCDFLNVNKKDIEVSEDKVFLNDSYIYDLICDDCDEELTQILYKNGIFSCQEKYENHPVILVTWNGAVAYCKWLSAATGKQYRLPNEAEWEYAASGGRLSQNYIYAGSNDVYKVAIYQDKYRKSTSKISQKEPNELNLYDMSGNVWEWCSDAYESADAWREMSAYRVVKGGSWRSNSQKCQIKERQSSHPDNAYSEIGFRIVWSESN